MKNIDNMTGSDIRQYIKQMWKRDKKVYEDIINYLARYDKQNVREKLIRHCNKHKTTFNKETLKSLLKVFTRFQEEAIQESMTFLDFIMKNLESGKGSKKLFKKKFNQKIKKKTFRKSVSQKNFLKKSLIKKSKKKLLEKV